MDLLQALNRATDNYLEEIKSRIAEDADQTAAVVAGAFLQSRLNGKPAQESSRPVKQIRHVKRKPKQATGEYEGRLSKGAGYRRACRYIAEHGPMEQSALADALGIKSAAIYPYLNSGYLEKNGGKIELSSDGRQMLTEADSE